MDVAGHGTSFNQSGASFSYATMKFELSVGPKMWYFWLLPQVHLGNFTNMSGKPKKNWVVLPMLCLLHYRIVYSTVTNTLTVIPKKFWNIVTNTLSVTPKSFAALYPIHCLLHQKRFCCIVTNTLYVTTKEFYSIVTRGSATVEWQNRKTHRTVKLGPALFTHFSNETTWQ